ncbi:FAD-dependent monooxygenase [Actinocatenispora sera]|uniref:FAD-dependent monooxygenase n=1 Tax=Actinocatenispora sera TaxID=390989 RepID=UPI0033CD2790
MRIVVIGAGLGGLALARRLRREGFDVGVVERDASAEARFQGYRIGLEPDGLAALRGCLTERLLPLLDAVAGEMTGAGRAVDPQLNLLAELPPRYEGLLFDRAVLRHLLLAGIEDIVTFDRHLTGYREHADGVVLTYADGSTETADLVVGADGMGSTVRRQLLPDVEVRDLGRYGGIGRTPLTERFADLVPGWSTMVSAPDVQLMLGKMPFRRSPRAAAAELAPEVALPDTPSYLRWVMLLPPDRAELGAHLADDQDGGLAVLRSIAAGWHPDLVALLAEADRANSGVGPLRLGDPVEPWETGRVTLLGDAGHPVPPGGAGAALAFLDAADLTNALVAARDGGTTRTAALAGYEQRMCARGAESRAQALAVFQMFDAARSAS